MEWKKERGRSPAPASTGDAEDAEPHWGAASTSTIEERHGPQPPRWVEKEEPAHGTREGNAALEVKEGSRLTGEERQHSVVRHESYGSWNWLALLPC
jgi:hypothetical protein